MSGLPRLCRSLRCHTIPKVTGACLKWRHTPGSAMSARFKAKSWLQGLQLDDFTKFVEYILGDRVGNLKLPTATGQETQFNRPPWNIVLSYEYKLRVEAFKRITEDGFTMSESLRAVREDTSLKESYFTTPLALHTASTPSKVPQGKSQG